MTDPEAFTALENLVAAHATKNPVRSQWVAQLASKTEGIADTSQTATPFSLVDIGTEAGRFRQVPEYGSQVRAVHLGDWASTTAGPTPMWVIFVDLGYSNRAEVTA